MSELLQMWIVITFVICVIGTFLIVVDHYKNKDNKDD